MPRPLTKQTKIGELYKRPHEIDAAIDLALTQELETVVARATVRDRNAPDFLRNEVLVHLIRQALRRGDERAMNRLVAILLERCRRILRAKVPDSVPRAADIRDEILGRFSERIAEDAAGGQNRLDVYECRFGLALRALRCDVIDRFEVRKREVSIEDDDRDDNEDDAPRHDFRADSDCEPARVAIAKDMLARIEKLPAAQRKAFVLYHLYEYEIESIDPEKITVATLCGVTGRTVRNLLQRAAAELRAQEMTP